MDHNWPRIIDAQTHELPILGRDGGLPEDLRVYAQVLAAFLQGDSEKLEAISKDLPAGPVAALADLRLKFRRRELEESDMHSSQKIEGPLEAERNFVLGMAWEQLGADQRSMEAFQTAARLYKEFRCPRKSLRAMYNSIAAESRIYPHKNFVADCQAVIEASRALKDLSFEGMALIMISREYQVAGLFDQAMQMISQSVDCLSSERGTIHYFQALLQKAHLHLDLKQDEKALDILKEVELASFAPIQAARMLLLCAIYPDRIWNRALEEDLQPTWRNRIPQLVSRKNPVSDLSVYASELEMRFLKIVYNGPVEKWDLITRLYPDEKSSLTVENRFKNLIARVRKKHPVQCIEGRYSIDKMPVL